MRKVSKMRLGNVLMALRFAKEDLAKVRDFEPDNLVLIDFCGTARTRIDKVSNMLTELLEKEG